MGARIKGTPDPAKYGNRMKESYLPDGPRANYTFPMVTQNSGPAGYSGTPLPKKLGIKEGSTVALVSPPNGFTKTLGVLPVGAKLHQNPRAPRDLTVCFVRSLKDLRTAIPKMVTASRQGGVWFAWPKKTSALAADVSETEVRELGLAAGLVDHKICAIDHDWSGLRFALRKKEGSK